MYVKIIYQVKGENPVKKINVEQLDKKEIEKRGIQSWGIWEKEPSEFDWSYIKEEHCYIIEGRADIETENGIMEIKQGDYIVFPMGLNCRWKVTERVKKYYDFR